MAILVALVTLLGVLACAQDVEVQVNNGSTQVIHDGSPKGYEKKLENLVVYLTGKKSDTAVVYLTDMYGIKLEQNRLLADSFALAGFFTVAPDLFNGSPARADTKGDGPSSGSAFNEADFMRKHDMTTTDAIVRKTIDYMRVEMGAKKVAVTGYAFGGRYAFRAVGDVYGHSAADAAFAAYPTGLEGGEVQGIRKPLCLAAAEKDDGMSLQERGKMEEELSRSGSPYQVTIYGSTVRGFAVSAKVSDPRQKFAQEAAFAQAVSWFKSWT